MDRVDQRLVADPGGARRRASTAWSSSGRERHLLDEAERRARSSGPTGAVRQSLATAFQTSSPSAYDATAPWESVQKWQLVEERGEAGEELSLARRPRRRARSAWWSASENGLPKSSGR